MLLSLAYLYLFFYSVTSFLNAFLVLINSASVTQIPPIKASFDARAEVSDLLTFYISTLSSKIVQAVNNPSKAHFTVVAMHQKLFKKVGGTIFVIKQKFNLYNNNSI